MATIKSTLALNDRMSGTLGNVVKAMNSTLHAMRAVKGENLGKTFETAAADIKLAEKSINDFNNSLDDMRNKQDKVSSGIKGLISGYAILKGVTAAAKLSDEYTSTSTRLDLINDGLQTNVELQDKIFASAQRSRAVYQDTAAAVAKLGTTAQKSFSSNDEMIAFVELMNKQFIVGGTRQAERASAMYQLTQAMSSGRLQGDEYRSIIENAPLLAKSIEDYMVNVQGATGSMKEWASQGLLTADVIKAALFSTADDVNKKFEKMPMTWSQVWTQTMNNLYKLSMPLLKFVNMLANNWDILQPIILGVAAAVGVYLIATKGVAAATAIWTSAQKALNVALTMNPIGLIIMAIVLVIAMIYAVVAAINKVTGSSVSATGVIMGAIFTAGAFIWNIVVGVINAILKIIDFLANAIIGVVEWVLNICNGGFNSFGDAVANLIGNVISWFLSLGQIVTTIIDAIFGTNWTAGLESLKGSVTAWGKNENAITLERWDHQLDRVEYGDAYNAGYSFGKGIDSKVSGFFGGADTGLDGLIGTDSTGEKAIKTTTNDSLISDDDIQLLLDVATRDYKLNYQQVTPEITLTFGDIHETADVDGIIDEVADRLEEIYDGNLEVG